MQQCPGVKNLWCEALREPLVSFVPGQQLSDAIQLMYSKEIRLRHEPPEGLVPMEVQAATARGQDATAVAAAQSGGHGGGANHGRAPVRGDQDAVGAVDERSGSCSRSGEGDSSSRSDGGDSDDSSSQSRNES